MNVADVLERAADLIERKGHAKKTLTDSRGAHCVLGALSVSVCGRDRGGPMHKAYVDAFWCLDKALGCCVVGWNNAPKRTAAEVTSTLRACAAVERARAAVAETVTA